MDIHQLDHNFRSLCISNAVQAALHGQYCTECTTLPPMPPQYFFRAPPPVSPVHPQFFIRRPHPHFPQIPSKFPQIPQNFPQVPLNFVTMVPPSPPPAQPVPSVLSKQVPADILPQIRAPHHYPPNSGPFTYRIISESSLSNLFQRLLHHNHGQQPDSKNNLVRLETSVTNFRKLSPEDQLSTFLSSQHLPPSETLLRWQIAFDTLELLRRHYPQCQLYVFGSLLTDLGTLSSDVDMYVDLFGDDGLFYQRQKYPIQAVKQMRNQINQDLLQTCGCPHNPRQRFALSIQSLGKRVPFLRYLHAPSGVHCDLSFGNRISFQNSKLLQFYMDYDPRVRPLLIFLRYWLQYHGLAGELKIKQYGLALMVLVCLMKTGSMPTVEFLQILKESERLGHGELNNPDAIEGWDASFCEDKQRIEQAFRAKQNRSRIVFPVTPKRFIKLVEDFFDLYSRVDFENQVICAWTGKIVHKEIFLPEVGKELKTRGKDVRQLETFFQAQVPLCIQDPFVLDFNVGGVAKQETVQEFKEMCKMAVKQMQTENGNGCILDFLKLTNLQLET